MNAEFPPEADIAQVLETVTMYDPVDCAMWRLEIHCPNTTDRGLLCIDSKGRRFVIPQCPLCAQSTRYDLTINQQITNQVLTIFEFNPEFQQRIPMSDILGSLNKSSRADAMMVANALKAHGATKERTRDGARWNGLRWRA